MMMTFLSVALGGAIGASARFAVNLAAARLFGMGFPVGTLCVNVLGSFAMGVLAVVLLDRASPLAPFLLTGVLGGFTTFSAFALDTTVLWQRGDSGLAMGYVLASVVLSLAAVSAGLAIGRGIFA